MAEMHNQLVLFSELSAQPGQSNNQRVSDCNASYQVKEAVLACSFNAIHKP
jgi:hypothetical protein